MCELCNVQTTEEHTASQLTDHLRVALGHLIEHHLDVVMRALVHEIDSMTSDMGFYLDNQSACDAFDVAAEALKQGLAADSE